ncbi:hypothetical protein KXV85_006098, partial [Aspergillus fumigatus]
VLPIVEGLVLLAALVLPFVLQDYLTVFATRVVILALFALSFDLVWGYAGIMSFGQALFFGSAGYGVALLARDAGIALMAEADKLAGIPGIIVQGRYDLLCPPKTSHALAARWREAEIRIVEGAGHTLYDPGVRNA